jgi:hypothetical protein
MRLDFLLPSEFSTRSQIAFAGSKPPHDAMIQLTVGYAAGIIAAGIFISAPIGSIVVVC